MLETAYSPCPNDTFMFYAWASGKLASASPIIKPVLADIQELNQRALLKTHPITKLSFFCLGHVLDDYVMLPVGAALGHDCGPKIISLKKLAPKDIKNLTIAIPGRLTTAHLLLDILCESPKKKIFCLYHEVSELIKTGKADCGLIIHESRFTYLQEGFCEIADLGELWQNFFKSPLPLGCIAALRSLGRPLLQQITLALSDSLYWSQAHPGESQQYILTHSIEKDPQIIMKHIELYVNEESFKLSSAGKRSIDLLFSQARKKKLIPNICKEWLFIPKMIQKSV